MILAFLVGSAFFGFSILISKITGIKIISSSNFGSSLIIYLIIVSLVPFINITSFSWKNPLPKIKGVNENALLLNCSYEKIINYNILETKQKIKEIINSLIFRDNELIENYEDDDHIEYYIDVKEGNEFEKQKKTSIVYKNTSILISFEEIDKENTGIKILVESDNPINIFANNFNREILNFIIPEIDKA